MIKQNMSLKNALDVLYKLNFNSTLITEMYTKKTTQIDGLISKIKMKN
jgi:hypothetical protein